MTFGISIDTLLPDEAVHMIAKRLFVSLVGTIFVLQLVAGVPGRDLRVLCVGQDGHREIEAAQRGRCFDNLAQSASRTEPDHQSNVTQDNSHCGPCTDMPLISAHANSLALSSRLSAPNPVQKSYCAELSLTSLAAGLCTRQPFSRNNPTHLSPTPLRTVVLLI